jgi:FixJ family two-component response regulator
MKVSAAGAEIALPETAPRDVSEIPSIVHHGVVRSRNKQSVLESLGPAHPPSCRAYALSGRLSQRVGRMQMIELTTANHEVRSAVAARATTVVAAGMGNKDRRDGTDRAKHSPVIYVIDSDEDVRATLGRLFHSARFSTRLLSCPGEFAMADGDAPACLVLDVRSRDWDGLAFQAELRNRKIEIPIIIMSAYANISLAVRVMRAGAITLLPKPFRDDEILEAVSDAIEIDRYRRAARRDDDRIRNRFGTLTAREREVMGLVTAGLMNKQVADRLRLSEITVKIHRGNLMRKMGAQSLADLVHMAGMLQVRQAGVTRFGHNTKW